MSARVTVALQVLCTDYHVTLCFFRTAGKLAKVSTSDAVGLATVTAVEYWPGPDVTVALVDSDLVRDRCRYWWPLGYKYQGHAYRAHFTIGRGDLRASTPVAPGQVYPVGAEYFRIYG